MSIKPATEEQIALFQNVMMNAWGGEEKVNNLMQASKDYKRAFLAGVRGRYEGELQLITPWVKRLVPDIAERRLFEIGCGQGSGTAAFATICRSVSGFDIDPGSVQIAQERLRLFGVPGSTATAATFPAILHRLDTEEFVDGVLLFAVLEHMYPLERVEVLRRAWKKLSPGGIVVVGETPNRLCYFDTHTYHQPFVNILPPELAKLWGRDA